MDPSSEPATGYLITKLGQAITARFTERLRGLDIRPRHFGLLVALANSPAGSQKDLGRVIGIVPSAIVLILDDLEARGAVARVIDPGNRRRFVVELTTAGRALLADASRIGAEVDDEILGALTPDERRSLHESLGRIVPTT